MHLQLSNYIQQYGGKAGVLQLLYDYYPQLHKYLAFQRILPYGQEISKSVFKEVLVARSQYGTREILARLSEPRDWFGLVDYLPTITVEDLGRYTNFLGSNRKEFQQHIFEKIGTRLQYKSPEYTKNLHLILTPKIPHTLYTVTEHPNGKGHWCFDTLTRGRYVMGKPRRSYDVFKKDGIFYDSFGDMVTCPITKSILEPIDIVSDLDIFPEGDKIQYEFGVPLSGGLPLIFQAKKFSNQFPELAPNFQYAINQGARIMGNLPSEQDVLYHSYRQNLSQLPKNDQFKGNQKLLFTSEEARGSYDFTTPPPFLKGFICETELALMHKLTAITQAVLQNDGFALLNVSGPGLDNQYITLDTSGGELNWKKAKQKNSR